MNFSVLTKLCTHNYSAQAKVDVESIRQFCYVAGDVSARHEVEGQDNTVLAVERGFLFSGFQVVVN